MKVFIETYGCQMNVADSELVASILKQKDFTIVDNIDDVKGKVAEALSDLSFTITEQSSLLRSKSNALLESFASTLDESLNSWSLKNETSIATAKTDADSLSKELKGSISSLANELKEKSVGLTTEERNKSLQSFEEIGN